LLTKEIRGILIAIILSLIAYILSSFIFNEIQARLIAVVVILVVLWTNEALPLGVVSLLPIILFPTLGILDPKSVSINYSKTIIFLFLGGFLLAIAVEKIGLHKVIANKILSVFPKTTKGVIFSLSMTSAILSSFLSNTTTALLLMPIALFLTNNPNLKIRFVLAIAYGASIGGIITPIGTPPNLILMGFLEEKNLHPLPFIVWMLKTFPLAIIMLIIVSFILSLGLKENLVNKITSKVTINNEQKRLLKILFFLIFILLINSFLKFNESIILLSFGLAMFLPKIGFLTWEDTKKIPYEIIFLFGAGFSIAAGFSNTNLAKDISTMLLDLTNLHPFLLLLIVATLITFTTEITSNTALISIALPIIYSLGKASNIDTYTILMVATICASYAFMLPIATPPNAIAMSSGVLNIKDMAKFGIIFNIIAIFLTTTIALIYW